MTQRLAIAAAILWVTCSRLHAHQLDEYLQATRILVGSDRITVEMGLTPGVAVVPRILALVDADRDGRASPGEIESYARRLLQQQVVLSVDGSVAPLTITRVEQPAWDEVRDGTGTIRIEATAAIERLSSGRHAVRIVNAHAPAISVYLVNALVPSDPRIVIRGQRRDMLQHGLDLDVDVAWEQAGLLWSALAASVVVALALARIGRIGRPASATR